MTGRSPTRRGLMLLLGSAALLLAAVTAQAGWLFVLGAGALGVAVASLLAPHRLQTIEVERQLPARVSVGEPVPLGVSVRNVGRGPARLLLATDRFPALEATSWLCERLAPGVTARARLETTARLRGVHARGKVELECGWPFGLFRSRRQLEVRSDLIVLPRVVKLRSSPLDPAGGTAPSEAARAFRVGGSELAGVREYRPGDPARAVHWRSSARRGELVVRELQDETRGHLACVLAARDAGDPPESCFEALVTAAACMAEHALARGYSLSVACGEEGADGAWPAGTSSAPALDALAVARPHDGLLAPLRRVLTTAPADAQVAIFSANSGQAGAELAAAVRSVAAAGRRALLVVALAKTWDRRVVTTAASPVALSERATVRTIARGQEPAECLEA